jgi:hypothetical protein
VSVDEALSEMGAAVLVHLVEMGMSWRTGKPTRHGCSADSASHEYAKEPKDCRNLRIVLYS